MQIKLQNVLSKHNIFQDQKGNVRQRLFLSKKFIFCIDPTNGEEEVHDLSLGKESEFLKQYQLQTEEGLKWIYEL